MRHPRHTIEYWRQHINAMIIDQYQKYLKGKVVDLGCGEGWMSYILVEYPKIKHVTAIDVDGAQLPESTDDIDFVVADLEELRMTAKFDSGICFHTLEHLPKLDKAVDNIYGLMKPNSHLVVSVPHGLAYYNETHVNFFDVGQLVDLMRRGQFETVECYYDDRTDGLGQRHDCVTGLFKKL